MASPRTVSPLKYTSGPSTASAWDAAPESVTAASASARASCSFPPSASRMAMFQRGIQYVGFVAAMASRCCRPSSYMPTQASQSAAHALVVGDSGSSRSGIRPSRNASPARPRAGGGGEGVEQQRDSPLENRVRRPLTDEGKAHLVQVHEREAWPKAQAG